ncbi:MAG: hypothetical protein ACFFE8_16880 [Candidatus Heimdallarchaeota archaeon]
MTALDKTFGHLPDGTTIKIGNGEEVYRLHSYENNPIIGPIDSGLTWLEKGTFLTGSIFNPGATIFDQKVILSPRIHAKYQKGKFFDDSLRIERIGFTNYISKIWILISDDGINFERYHRTLLKGDGTTHRDFFYGIEDTRIIERNGYYLLLGCGKIIPPFQGLPGNKGDRIAVYSTKDFVEIRYHGIIPNIDMRNAVIFPATVSGKNYILLRLGKNIHIDVMEAGIKQLLNPSKYGSLWKKIFNRQEKTKLLEVGHYPHEKEKIGSGPPPIRTEKGWLLIYHAVGKISSSIGRIYGLTPRINRSYSICAALLDLNDPTKVLCRTKYPIYIPSKPWELYGNEIYPVDVPAVVFPMGLIVEGNKMLLYAGAGDKYVILLGAHLNSFLEFLWQRCRL